MRIETQPVEFRNKEMRLGPPAAFMQDNGLDITYKALDRDAQGAYSFQFDAAKNDFSPSNTPEDGQSPISRYVPITRALSVISCKFGPSGVEGGLEVRGPLRAAAQKLHQQSNPTSPNVTKAEAWGAAPLIINIIGNTFSSMNVLRFVGALPPRSQLIIEGNIPPSCPMLVRQAGRQHQAACSPLASERCDLDYSLVDMRSERCE